MTADDPMLPDASVIARAEGRVLLREARRRGWTVTGVAWESGTSVNDEVETTSAEPVSIADMAPGTHAYIEGRFGDDGVCHAHTPGQTNYSAWPGRCYRLRADRVHFDPSKIRDVIAAKES